MFQQPLGLSGIPLTGANAGKLRQRLDVIGMSGEVRPKLRCRLLNRYLRGRDGRRYRGKRKSEHSSASEAG
jgi:hypothetical protein